jgi:hypothetical protein
MSTATDSELGVGVLHDLHRLGDLIGTARAEHTLRVHELVVRPELRVLILVHIVAAVEDRVRDALAEGVAAIGAALLPNRKRNRSSGAEKQWRNSFGQHRCYLSVVSLDVAKIRVCFKRAGSRELFSEVTR